MNALKVIDGGHRAPSESELLSCLEAEEAVLFGCINAPEVLLEVRGLMKPEQFHSESNRKIFESAVAISEAGQPVDVVAVLEHLRQSGRLAQVGGAKVLTGMGLYWAAVTPRSARALCLAIQAAWARRALLGASSRLQAGAALDPRDILAIASDHAAECADIVASLSEERSSSDALAVMTGAIELAKSAAMNAGVGARPTGFHGLDRLTAGLHSELTLLGARPGMGKTSLATDIAVNVARRGEPAYVATLETPATTLGLRMACSSGRVSMHAARAGLLTMTDWSKLTPAVSELAGLPICIDDRSAMTVAELWSACRREQVRRGKSLGIVVVDYIQLLRAPRSGMKREEVVAENARALKAMAQDLDCPVLALAQLNRASEQRGDHRPCLADLRESGELEQCARTVMFLYRKDYYRQPTEQKTGEAELIVAKQNNGPTGHVMMRFDGASLRFDEAEA